MVPRPADQRPAGAALVNPHPGRRPPDAGRAALMLTSDADLERIRVESGIGEPADRTLMSSRFYAAAKGRPFSIIGPMTGAPYAVILLENLIAWGVRNILYLGWCGAVSPDLSIGDLLIADDALADEGTSPAYGVKPFSPVPADPLWTEILADAAREPAPVPAPGADPPPASVPGPAADAKPAPPDAGEAHPARRGRIWTTDAVFRETPEKIEWFRRRGALAVEMEVSALFAVARFRGVSAAAILAVSDDLSGDTWQPGFRDPRFRRARGRARRIARKVLIHHALFPESCVSA